MKLELLIAIPVFIGVLIFFFSIKGIYGRLMKNGPKRIATHLGLKKGAWITIPKRYRKFPFYEGSHEGIPTALYLVHFKVATYQSTRRGNIAFTRLVTAVPNATSLDYEANLPPMKESPVDGFDRPLHEVLLGKNLDRVPPTLGSALKRFVKQFDTFYLVDRSHEGKTIVPTDMLSDYNILFVHDMKGVSHENDEILERLERIHEIIKLV